MKHRLEHPWLHAFHHHATTGGATATSGLQGAELRAAQKEASATERRIEKLQQQIDRAKAALVDHDQADYEGLGKEMQRISALEGERDELEMKWFELTETIG